MLILTDAEGHELCRRPMAIAERLDFYQCYLDDRLYDYNGTCWRLVTVRWRMPEEECIVAMTREGAPPPVYVYDDC